jgi:hypothetical protein
MVEAKESLGHVDVTSGVLLVFDFGLIDAFEAAGSAKAAAVAAFELGKTELPVRDYVNAIMVRGVMPGRYPVSCERLVEGELAGLRRIVTIDFSGDDRLAARTVELGDVPVDCARIGVFDVDAIDHWNHTQPGDGRADIVFWGRDEERLAERFQAPRLEDGTFGFVDCPFDEALATADELQALRASGELRFAFDFRPHTDAFFLLAQLRKNPTEAGVIEVGGHAVCGFMTTWGDGFFPATLELDSEDRPLRCIINFVTEDNTEAMKEVNGL